MLSRINGAPLLNAEHLIGDEPFIYTWSDDFIKATPYRFQQMIDMYNKHQCPIISAISASSDEDYDKYGYADGEEIEDGVIKISRVIEKPGKENAPSDMATVSGYLLTPDIFSYLHKALDKLEEGKELYSNDMFKLMLEDNKKLIAYKIKDGQYFDSGNKLDYMKANILMALEDPDLNHNLRDYLKTIL